jgi:SAM-dependent methyltransferase
MADPIADQHQKWSETFATRPDFLGSDASEPGRAAATRFATAHAVNILELGPGQGRDTLFFAERGFRVTALDFAQAGLDQIMAKAGAMGVGTAVQTVVGDVRDPLPRPVRLVLMPRGPLPAALQPRRADNRSGHSGQFMRSWTPQRRPG